MERVGGEEEVEVATLFDFTPFAFAPAFNQTLGNKGCPRGRKGRERSVYTTAAPISGFDAAKRTDLGAEPPACLTDSCSLS